MSSNKWRYSPNLTIIEEGDISLHLRIFDDISRKKINLVAHIGHYDVFNDEGEYVDCFFEDEIWKVMDDENISEEVAKEFLSNKILKKIK